MSKETEEYAAIFWRVEPNPPGRTVQNHITPLRIKKDVPTEVYAEVDAEVRQ